MSDSRDSSGALLPDSVRLSPVGKWLRSTSIDELPELLNILRGEMSLLASALVVAIFAFYTPEQARRHDVCLALVVGPRNGRNAISWEKKFELDVWYVDHQSFWLDLRIFILTIWTVIRRDGICAAGEATMPPFRGTAAQQ